jgi:hypothetical protein
MLLRAHIETSQAEVRKITLHQVHPRTALKGMRWSKVLRIGVTRLAHDAQAAILCERAAGPTVAGVLVQPLGRERVVHMISVVQRDQHVDIEQRAHQMPSSSRRRSINSLLTKPPREGKG